MTDERAVEIISSPAQMSELDLQQNSNPGEGNAMASKKDAGVQDDTSTLITVQTTLSQVLDFLSRASNDTIGACLAGLVAVTYMVLGRLGLILIGVVVGVVLHATWQETINPQPNAFALLLRILDLRETKTSEDGFDGEVERSESSSIISSSDPFSNFPPSIGAALNDLTEAVIREHVSRWYSPILPLDSSFPATCRSLLTKFFVSVSSHISRKRPADAFLNFLTHSSSIIIVFLHEISNALMTTGSGNSDSPQTLHRYLESNPDSNLANILSVEQQKKKLQAVADDILRNFLDPKAYQLDVSKTFLRELLAGLVFESIITSCSKQEWINGWIIYLLEQGDATNSDASNSNKRGSVSRSIQAPASESQSTNGLEMDAGVGSPSRSLEPTNETHKGTVSRAEFAMEEAMQEAKRLSELIAAEEARKGQNLDVQKPSDAMVNGFGSSISQPNGHVEIDGIPVSKPDSEVDTENSKPLRNKPEQPSGFTNFDQILGSKNSTSLSHEHESRGRSIPPLTLHNATVSIFDDYMPEATMRSKPSTEYLLQIEPALSLHPGWMTARRYVDFENLHEVLRRISVVSGVPQFTQKHGVLPSWKDQTKGLLCKNLELYLRDALSFSRLAESESMKRFLEKDQGLGRVSPTKQKTGFGFPGPNAFENMGKGMLDVLASAPKGAAGRGKALLGGVSGVFGGMGSMGQKEQARNSSPKSPAPCKTYPVGGEKESKEQKEQARNSSPKSPAPCKAYPVGGEKESKGQKEQATNSSPKSPAPCKAYPVGGEKESMGQKEQARNSSPKSPAPRKIHPVGGEKGSKGQTKRAPSRWAFEDPAPNPGLYQWAVPPNPFAEVEEEPLDSLWWLTGGRFSSGPGFPRRSPKLLTPRSSVTYCEVIPNDTGSAKAGSPERLHLAWKMEDSLASQHNVDGLHLPPLPNEIPDDYKISPNDTGSAKAGSPERLPLAEKRKNSLASQHNVDGLHLPPLPNEILDDYKISQESSRTSMSLHIDTTSSFTGSTTPTSQPSPTGKSTFSFASGDPVPHSPKRKNPLPMTGKETQVAVELFFAVINELYNLSSAWSIRRTLLNAAKGFLLRPGNPNLEAIRLLLQETIIDANTSEQGIATHLRKLRENALPTADELQKWPKAPTQEEKDLMRVKARKLLVEKGMPLALTSVMGVAASGEALGKIFDCLQVEEVARGLMFSVTLQGLKAATQ